MADDADPTPKRKGRSRVTLAHAFAVSLALHGSLALPFVLHRLMPSPDAAPTLVVELQGVITQRQTEQKILREVQGETRQDEVRQEHPPTTAPVPAPREASEERPDEPVENAFLPPPAVAEQKTAEASSETTPATVEAIAGAGGVTTVAGAEDEEIAQTIPDEVDERQLIQEYVRELSKRVQSNLVRPGEGGRDGRRHSATVAFAILGNGQIRPDSLRIIRSSGQPRLDTSALQTIRTSLPFPPPPKEMTIAIIVDFDPRR